MTLKQWLRSAEAALTAAGIDNASGESRSLLAAALKCDENELWQHILPTQPQTLKQLQAVEQPQAALTKEEAEAADGLLKRRLQREPLQHIIGCQWFYGYRFNVSPAVLIPRWDTENLVEACLCYLRQRSCESPLRVCDVCTGSGCIAVTIALEQSNTAVTAIDISPAALAVAKTNAAELGAQIDFRLGDLMTELGETKEVFDLIVSNPPYIKSDELQQLQPEVRLYDPELALDGGEDGLVFYRRLAAQAKHHLAEGGLLALEIGADQATAVSAIVRAEGYREPVVKRDLAGFDRVVLAIWSSTQGNE